MKRAVSVIILIFFTLLACPTHAQEGGTPVPFSSATCFAHLTIGDDLPDNNKEPCS